MSTIKVGDVVFLNSGSPELTVENITDGFVKCIWFNCGEAESGVFNVACLTLK